MSFFSRSAAVSLILHVALFPVIVFAEKGEILFESSLKPIQLIELYSSEGCSSCPPADRFVSNLSRSGPGPRSLMTLAFHVDYWDYLGWKDIYARPEYGARQRTVARRNGLRTVYTPQLVINGLNFPSYQNIEKAVRIINEMPARAMLRIDAQRSADGKLRATVTGTIPDSAHRPDAELFLAVYENNLERSIGAGENHGRVLRHDRVVHRLIGPVAADGSGALRLERDVEVASAWKPGDIGVVAFVQNSVTGEVLQGVQLPLAKLF